MGNVSGKDEGESGVFDDENDPRSRSPAVHRRVRSLGGVAASPPDSPGRLHSPLMFAPQIPVPPLQPAPDATPMFQEVLMNECDPPTFVSPEKGIPQLITWNRGGNSVFVEGSWDNWSSRKALQRSGKDRALLLVLPCGVYHYRFIVDGQLNYIPDLPFVVDDTGNANNILDVHDYVPENIESISEFDSPPSPDSSYSWSFPPDEDFAKEPPAVPPQLHLTVLGMQNPNEASPKPQHVVLNHLFIEKGGPSQSMVALGLTHRFQSKYVTVVLYKPVRKVTS